MRAWCCLACSLLLSVAASSCAPKTASEPVWIGQLLPLEGPNRTVGLHARQGAELAIADATAAEQTIAGHPCAVLHVDGRGDPATVKAETVRLLTVNKVAALLAEFDVLLTEQMLRANQPYGVPMLVPGELPAAIESESVVSLGVPPAVRGRLLAKHLSSNLPTRRAAVLTDSRNPVAAALAAAFVKAWPRKDGVIEEWTFAASAERDERATRLIQTAPAVILLACSVSDFRMLRPRLTAALPKIALIYGGPDSGAAPLQADLEPHADVYLATTYSADHLTESGRAFAQRYQERFHEPPDLHAAQAFDAVRLLLGAMQRIQTASKEPLVKELNRLEEFDGVTGLVRWKDRQPRRRVFLIVLKDNQTKVVRIVGPEDN